MNAKIVSSLLILTLLATACVSEYNPVLPSDDKKILFVDGSIIENTDVLFRISQSFSLNEDTVPEESFVNNASLTIIGSNGYKSPAAINEGKGTYRIPTGALDDDVEYGIQIEYDGDTYQSALSKPLHTPEIDSISWTQPDSIGTVFFHVSTHDNTGAGTRFFMWNYTEDWEIKSVYPTAIFYRAEADTFYVDWSLPYYYCWRKNESGTFLIGSTESLRENKLVNKQLYEQGSEDDRFSELYSVIVTQRAISKDAYEYYQSIKKQNEDMDGLFTPQPSEITGNITCITEPSKKVIGYVETVKNRSQKRIFVYPEQLRRPVVYSDCDPLFLTNGKLPEPGQYAYFYKMGWRPAEIDSESYAYHGIIIPSEWALSHCTDCRDNGGTKNKPDFWPNWHW
ncbi:MAG: DUF4249 domain-containing protein [Dysgonamonadaceae bacterium]|jgi:hypothetical protein|nr:DUF4249 domain-containing protein [Dysgonamonadaceae bacterium]